MCPKVFVSAIQYFAVFIHACMYDHHIQQNRINRVRLPATLPVTSRTGEMNIPLSPFAAENLAPGDRCVQPSRPACACTFSTLRLTVVLDSSRFPWLRPFIETAIRHRVNPEFIGSRTCVPIAFIAENPVAQCQ